MDQWISTNPAAVLALVGVLGSVIVFLARREIKRLDEMESKVGVLDMTLREHMIRGDTTLKQLLSDVAEVKARIQARSPESNHEFRGVVDELRAAVRMLRSPMLDHAKGGRD